MLCIMKLKYFSLLLVCASLAAAAAPNEPRPLALTPETKFVALPDYATVGKYIIDGGQMLVGGITLGKEDPLAALFIELVAGHDTFGTVSKGRYRLELTQFDPSTGECTFGDLERFHPRMGWILSDDYPSTHEDRGFLSVNVDASISGEFFRGLHMKPCSKRQVQWTPPKSWSEDAYDALVKDLLQQLGALETDWDMTFGK